MSLPERPTTDQQPAPRRRRHLMDPNAPRPQNAQARARAQKSLTRVQRWVMSVLVVTTILHLSAGLVIAAMFLDDRGRSAEIGLNVIAAAFGVVAVGAGLAIHGKKLPSPWLALGIIPGIIGLFLTLR